MKTSHLPLTPNDWQPILVTVAALATADLGAIPLMMGHVAHEAVFLLAVIVMGLLVAQGTLLNLAVVFGSGPFWLRMFVAWGVALVAMCGWAICADFAIPNRSMRDEIYQQMLNQFVAIIVFSLAGQVPLWAIRLLCGWRFIGPRTKATPAERQFSLADLIAATFQICVVIALVRAISEMNSRAPAMQSIVPLVFGSLLPIGYVCLFVLPVVAICAVD